MVSPAEHLSDIRYSRRAAGADEGRERLFLPNCKRRSRRPISGWIRITPSSCRGFLEALLASLLAVGEGIARRSLRTAVSGAVLGILVGGILGGLAGLAGFLLDNYLESFEGLSKLARTLCVQGVLLGGLGAAVGLAFGALTRRTSATLTCLAYGLLGGGLAALIWPVCAALVLPTMDPDCTFPSQGSVRLLWIAVVSVAFGLLIPEALRPRVPRHAPNASADA